MAKYFNVPIEVIYSGRVVVEADNPEQAVALLNRTYSFDLNDALSDYFIVGEIPNEWHRVVDALPKECEYEPEYDVLLTKDGEVIV